MSNGSANKIKSALLDNHTHTGLLMSSFCRVALSILPITAFVVPVAAQPPAAAGHIDTDPPRSVIELPFAFQSGTLTLPGTLTMPATYNGAPPAALIVAG